MIIGLLTDMLKEVFSGYVILVGILGTYEEQFLWIYNFSQCPKFVRYQLFAWTDNQPCKALSGKLLGKMGGLQSQKIAS